VVYRDEYEVLEKKWVEDKWNEGVLGQANNQTPAVELAHE
jgi:hypothetical protein